MQSTGVGTVDVDHTDAELNGINSGDVVLEPKTLPVSSNDVVIRESGESTLSLHESESESGVSGEVLNQAGAVEGESLEGEEGNEDMEVDFVENVGSIAVLEGSKNLVDGRESSSLEEKRGSINVEENGVENSDLKAVLGQSECSNVCGAEDEKGCGTSEPVVDGVDNQGNLGEASSSAQKLFPNTVKEDTVGKQVKAAGFDGSSTITVNAVEVNEPSSVVKNEVVGGTTNAVVSDEVNISDDVIEGVCFDSKDELPSEGVRSNKVVDLGSSVVKLGNKSRKKGGFHTSDLVWGKVRSHPWWPAQIFEPEDASEQAKKHFRSKSYLVAYFGDQTFAWNDEAKLKPFAPHFFQMAKQSTAEAFRHAVNCALDEAARRAEFGLSCRCIADDVYSRLKVQVVKNAGIREKSCIRRGGDRLYTASSFEPVKFLDYVKYLAQVPLVEENVQLEHVVTHAQMSAFYRWKGCYHLAEFGPLIGYVNNEADAPVSRKKDEMDQMIIDATVAPQEKMEEDDIRPQKRKKLSNESDNSSKKMKRLSDSFRKKGKKDGSKQNDSEETEGKTDRKFSSSSIERRKEAKLPSDESKSKESSPQITPSRESKPGLRVGESILRAALQLSQPSPLLKLDVSSHGKTTKGSSKSKQRRRETEADPFKKSSPDSILSKFLLAAVDPLKEHSFLSSMITLFSDLRDSVVQSKERPSGSGPEEMAEGDSSGSKSKEFGSDCEVATSSGFKSVEDGCCCGKVEIPEVQTSLSDEEMIPVDPELAKADVPSQQHCESENVASESGPSDKDILQEESPTALTLKFTDMDSIPTEAKLNKIFSAFGLLKESETEVLPKKNCARVVFKRRLDAETAFSSSGKFETFGASLVCYQLNYAPSPHKSPSPEAKRKR